MSPEDPRPEGFEELPPLRWSRIELALFGLFAVFIVVGVILALW